MVVEADGGSRGNPGPAGYGTVVRDGDTGEVLAERAGFLGATTNKVAEYQGLLAGLRAAAEFAGPDSAATAVSVRMDSKVVVEQMSGRWQVKEPGLAPLARQAATLVRSFGRVDFFWIPRLSNTHADRLANQAMDAAAPGRGGGLPSSGDGAHAGRAPVADWSAEGSRTPGVSQTPGWAQPESVPTRMLLLRHGETVHSVGRRFSGRGDLPLTERGREQAAAAAKRLAGHPDLAAVVSSPLGRARETAAMVARATGAELVIEDRLVETDFGLWEGLTFAEVRERWPAELAAWLASVDVTPPEGESLATVGRRVRRAREGLIATYPGQPVVVVSHVTPIKHLIRLGLDAGPSVLFRLHLDVASLSVVDWYADGPASVRLVNDTGHLG
ncbi:MAG: bifunctional RNase H/acid phosphatase [Actinobacteria bacterium]|nr:bifunctional RNase H/acid phosphatase [Actinomycetota bacterium]MBI3686292.1 bifunctional RNase H/acid phosphatase [Actinomycetota bacterium]